jgi:class 3 adenylate cyclase
LQKRFEQANDAIPRDNRIVLRVGVNLGDVVVEGGDLYGDGVIIAVRLQAMAEPRRHLHFEQRARAGSGQATGHLRRPRTMRG